MILIRDVIGLERQDVIQGHVVQISYLS